MSCCGRRIFDYTESRVILQEGIFPAGVAFKSLRERALSVICEIPNGQREESSFFDFGPVKESLTEMMETAVPGIFAVVFSNRVYVLDTLRVFHAPSVISTTAEWLC
jgi:hypothetical protein